MSFPVEQNAAAQLAPAGTKQERERCKHCRLGRAMMNGLR
jgi:hypothetical protein